jgi:hypothetical protein
MTKILDRLKKVWYNISKACGKQAICLLCFLLRPRVLRRFTPYKELPVKKLIVGLLLGAALLPHSPVFALQATPERLEFCTGLANLAGQAAAMKELGVPKDEFLSLTGELEQNLKDPAVGLTPSQQSEVVQAAKQAYSIGGPPAARAQDAFKTCITAVQI